MAFIGLAVPRETSRLFSDIEVPGQKTEIGTYHITLMYIGKEIPIEVLAEALKATYAVTSETKPFTVRTSRVVSFPPGDDGHPVIARVESDPLHDLREALVASFNDAGVDFNQKYPDFKPHVTLSYAEEPVEEFRIPTVEWGAHELVLWGGDDGDKKLVVTFPFVLGSLDRTAARVANRFMAQP